MKRSILVYRALATQLALPCLGSLAMKAWSAMSPCLFLVLVGAATGEQQALVQTKATGSSDYHNVCYFTNWARYRNGLINQQKDVFEMDLPGDMCTHLMYGFASVFKDANGNYALKSNDPNADHPSGHVAQTSLCPEVCNDPNFKPDWNDPNGERCQWPCSPSRSYRGYEGANVAMKRKNPSIKSLISVGGWNFNDCNCNNCWGQGAATCEIFSTIAASEGQTRAFAKNIIQFCRNWGFDGFDLDWEYPVVAGHNSNRRDANGDFVETPEDYNNYISMLRILREEFHNENANNPLLLTAAVGVGKSTVEKAYNIPAMSEYLDLINLMTYDLHGGWDPYTGCNANLHATDEDSKRDGYPLSVSWAVDYWIEHSGKPGILNMGLGAYGRGWKLSNPSDSSYGAPASGASAEGPSTKESGYLSFYEIEHEIESGATRHYDTERECPYIVTAGGEWVGYDDKQSLKAKLDFVVSRSLGGTMVWALDLDDFAGRYPLISYAKNYLSGDSPPAPTPAPTPGPTPGPTPAPTPSPTPAPTPEHPTDAPGGCDAVPGNLNGCTDENCQQCSQGYAWWPCNVATACC